MEREGKSVQETNQLCCRARCALVREQKDKHELILVLLFILLGNCRVGRGLVSESVGGKKKNLQQRKVRSWMSTGLGFKTEKNKY